MKAIFRNRVHIVTALVFQIIRISKMTKYFGYAVAIIWLLPLHIFAQQSLEKKLYTSDANNTGPGIITGMVLDSAHSQPVAYSTVALSQEANGKIIDGASCNQDGVFKFKNIPLGIYKLQISFIGYKSYELTKVIISSTNALVKTSNIFLVPTRNLLEEVVVAGDKGLIEDKIDRTVYNADKDVSNSGGTASDVLKKVPNVSIDLEGNVRLRGAGNIRILIDNKPSSIFAANVSEALRQFPADQIKSVEIITSPSARYDAEGTGGIINIVLKKNRTYGNSTSVNASAGTRTSSLSSGYSFRQNKISLNAFISSNAFYTHKDEYINIEQVQYGPNTLAYSNQFKSYHNKGISGAAQLSLDYDLTDKDGLSLSIRAGRVHYTNSLFINSSLYNNLTNEDFTRDIFNVNNSKNLDASLGYTKKISPKSDFSFLALHSGNTSYLDYALESNNSNVLNYKEVSYTTSPSYENTIQADYSGEVDSLFSLEAGVKTIFRESSINYDVFGDSLKNTTIFYIPSRSNKFNFHQNVYAAYFSAGHDFRSGLTVKVGIRSETTQNNLGYSSNTASMYRAYSNLTPSLFISRNFGPKKDRKLKFAYTSRIQRPSLYYLNPYINAQNPVSIVSGNPDLISEKTHNIELSYSIPVKDYALLNLSSYYRHTGGGIETITASLPNTAFFPNSTPLYQVVYTTYLNSGVLDNYGINAYFAFKTKSNVTLTTALNAYYITTKSTQLLLENKGLMYTSTSTFLWQFRNAYTIQANLSLNSQRIELQGRTLPFQYYSVTFKKDILNKKGFISLIVENPFLSSVQLKSFFAIDSQHNSISTLNYYNQAVLVNFSYKFDNGRKRIKGAGKSVRNDDQKLGGNNGQ